VKVSLFVTGVTEQAGLADALASLFPGHQFRCIAHTSPNRPFYSFTDNKLPVGEVTDGVRSTIDLLVQSASAEVSTYRGHEPPDLLLILDDLELANIDQPEVVVDCFRAAVGHHLDSLGPSLRRRTADALRARASLHFAVPMIESWFFADPGGLARAGVPASHRPPALPCAPRFESFETNDEGYSIDDCSWCEQWARILQRKRIKESTREAHQPEWCRGDHSDRHRHPKRYLAWLCRDPAAKKCSSYREAPKPPTDPGGTKALRELDWSALTAHTTDMPFLNAMLDDLADALSATSPFPPDAPRSPYTCRKHHTAAVLRNI
jgi:hypothetical protein